MTIHAYTESAVSPAYVNLKDNGTGTVKLTVRSRGKDGVTFPTADIDLTPQQLHAMAHDVIEYLLNTKAPA